MVIKKIGIRFFKFWISTLFWRPWNSHRNTSHKRIQQLHFPIFIQQRRVQTPTQFLYRSQKCWLRGFFQQNWGIWNLLYFIIDPTGLLNCSWSIEFQMTTFTFDHNPFDGPSEHIPAMKRVKEMILEQNFSSNVFALAQEYSNWETDEVNTLNI